MINKLRGSLEKKVSIVIPCRNEVKTIEQCLKGILEQDFPQEKIEIIVADGMSDDGSKEILKDFSKNFYSIIKVIDNPQKIIPCGLNAAIKESRGEIIVRIDAHSAYPTNYISKCLETLNLSNSDIVGGRVVNSVTQNASLIEKAIGIITSHPFGVGNSPFRTQLKAGVADSVAFGCFKREVFHKIGLFDERFIRNQDTEFWHRVRQNGGKIYFHPAIKSFYFNQNSIMGLLRQGFKTGLWGAYSYMLVPGMLKFRHFAPLFFVFYVIFACLGLSLGAFFKKELLFYLSLGMGLLYLSLNLVASVSMFKGSENIPGDIMIFPISVFLTPSYHLSYGFGWLYGFWNIFSGKWEKSLGALRNQTPSFLDQ